MYSITKKFEFCSAHKLNLDYTSKCSNLHGHNYFVAVTVKTKSLDSNGMVMDFSKLKKIQEWVNMNWDHKTLMSIYDPDFDQYRDLVGTIVPFYYSNVTAERMACDLAFKTKHLLSDIDDRSFGIKITIWETANNKATFELNV